MTFANDNDYISFRHHVFVKTGNQVELAEVGPRFEMRRKLLIFDTGVMSTDIEYIYIHDSV